MEIRKPTQRLRIPAYFIMARLILLISLPVEAIKGYGDHWNYFYQASLGVPFFDYWTEFPPLMPFLFRGIYLLSGGREHTFTYGLFLLLTLIQAGNIYLFTHILDHISGKKGRRGKAVLYGTILLPLFYGWGYFDPMVVCTMLLGILFVVQNRSIFAGTSIAVGALAKWFPLLLLPAIWKYSADKKQILKVFLIVIFGLSLVWGTLFALSPEMTRTSFTSQWAKGSWETLWALLDGNIRTGNFGDVVDRTDPSSLSALSESAVISPWMTLIVFAGVGFWVFFRKSVDQVTNLLAFTGLTVVIFFLWSPGYSPQWMLYFLPLILFLFPSREYTWMALVWTIVNLLEWPVLLSRGSFNSLYFLIPLRVLLLGLMGYRFYQGLSPDPKPEAP